MIPPVKALYIRRRIVIQAMLSRKLFIALLLFLAYGWAVASEWQNLDDITVAVEQFVRLKTADSGNDIAIAATRPDPRIHLGKCDNLETWLPNANKLWGRTSVGVRCRAPVAWSIYVPVTVKISGSVLVATHPIGRGQTLEAQDVQSQIRDLTPYPGGVLTSPDQAIGKTAAAAIQVGDLLRPQLLRSSLVVRQGQQVILVAQGAGFKVSSEGIAMGNATAGQVVSAKTRSGQIIKGIAKSEGVVEVYF
jgi:flagella basal body P-ring formation protein FlgA